MCRQFPLFGCSASVEWLCASSRPTGYSEADLKTMRCFNDKSRSFLVRTLRYTDRYLSLRQLGSGCIM